MKRHTHTLEARTMVCQIVDRIHVSASNRGVIHFVRARFAKGVARSSAYRSARKGIYREALARHAENQALYRFTRGTIVTPMGRKV